MLNKITRRIKEPKVVVQDLRKLGNKIIRPDIVSVRGVKVPIGPHISKDVLNYIYAGSYECDEADILQKKLRPDDVVVELGGGIGFISGLCSRIIGSDNIHVYEANRTLEPWIRKLYELNGITPHLNMFALGSEDGEIQFTVSEHFWESSAYTNNMMSPKELMVVPVKQFSKETSTYAKPATMLIIDIEGGEYEFFQNADLGSVRKILCEVHEQVLGKEKLDDMLATLGKKGFKLDKSVSLERVWYLEKT